MCRPKVEGNWGWGGGQIDVGDGKQIGVGVGHTHQSPLCAISGYGPEPINVMLTYFCYYYVYRSLCVWQLVHLYSLLNSQLCIVSSVQFNLFSQEKSVKGQPEKMSLEPCSTLTVTDGRAAKVKQQWDPGNWSCDEEALPPDHVKCYK